MQNFLYKFMILTFTTACLDHGVFPVIIPVHKFIRACLFLFDLAAANGVVFLRLSKIQADKQVARIKSIGCESFSSSEFLIS